MATLEVGFVAEGEEEGTDRLLLTLNCSGSQGEFYVSSGGKSPGTGWVLLTRFQGSFSTGVSVNTAPLARAHAKVPEHGGLGGFSAYDVLGRKSSPFHFPHRE